VASGGAARHRRRMTDVLVVTTAVRMLDRVLGDTPDARPVVSLRLGLVPAVDSLEERLVLPLAAGANTDHGSADTLDGLPLAGRELDSGDSAVVGVTYDDSGGAGCSGERAAISLLALDVGDDGTLRQLVDRKDVANREGSLGTAVNELAGVHSLDGDEILDSLLVAIGVPEGNLGERRTSTGIVNNVLNHSLDVTLSFSVVKSSESGGSHSVSLVRSKNETTTLSLCFDASTHSNRFTS